MYKIAFFIFQVSMVASIYSQEDHNKSRQFDFWIGQWDVKLRMIQPDNTWEDKVQSNAHIYSILGGKAILELWDESESGIIGHSLRYYNPHKDKWDLYLNWPGKNRSGTGYKEGFFRHERGEFYNTSNLQDTSLTIERYTFSDITPHSLRWDDGYSSDGGRSWSSNWIMEFTRSADFSPEMNLSMPLNTYYSGTRCDGEEFEVLKALVGSYSGDVTIFPILDGCSVMGISDQLYFKLTYNTYASMYELTVLDDQQDHELLVYYGNLMGDIITLKASKHDLDYYSTVNINTHKFSIEYHLKNLDLLKRQ